MYRHLDGSGNDRWTAAAAEVALVVSAQDAGSCQDGLTGLPCDLNRAGQPVDEQSGELRRIFEFAPFRQEGGAIKQLGSLGQ